jgi:hypothetical protein
MPRADAEPCCHPSQLLFFLPKTIEIAMEQTRRSKEDPSQFCQRHGIFQQWGCDILFVLALNWFVRPPGRPD